MVVLVFGNVVMRYGFNSGITVSEELSRWLFIWGTFLGALVALRERGHLGVDMVVARLPVLGKKVCLVAGHVLMIVILVHAVQGGSTRPASTGT
jgi:TRAP-type C4-dicarboxylate transport system permease small subunit